MIKQSNQSRTKEIKGCLPGRGLLSFCAVFTAAVVIQSLHMVEHIAQVIQKFVLGMSVAHGLIGMLDFEWVHFGYNAALLATLYILTFKCSRLLRARGTALFYIFVAGVVIQSYHMIEHVVKIIQHIQTGVQGTPGILGNFINLILFHFSINLVVLILVIIPFVGLGVYKQCTSTK